MIEVTDSAGRLTIEDGNVKLGLVGTVVLIVFVGGSVIGCSLAFDGAAFIDAATEPARASSGVDGSDDSGEPQRLTLSWARPSLRSWQHARSPPPRDSFESMRLVDVGAGPRSKEVAARSPTF